MAGAGFVGLGTGTSPANPSAGLVDIAAITDGPGVNTPPTMLAAIDSSGNKYPLGPCSGNSQTYRKIGEQFLTTTGAGTYTPSSGTRYAVVHCYAGGGAGGGGATGVGA